MKKKQNREKIQNKKGWRLGSEKQKVLEIEVEIFCEKKSKKHREL